MIEYGNIHNLVSIKEYVDIIEKGIEDDTDCKYSICLLNKEGDVIYQSSNFSEEEKNVMTSPKVNFHHKACEDYIKEYISIKDKDNNSICHLSVILTNKKSRNVAKALMTLAAKAIQKEILYNIHKKEIENLNQSLNKQNELYESQTKLLNFILDNTREMILIMDEEGKYVLLNKTAQELIQQGKITKLDDVYNNYRIYDNTGERLQREEDPTLLVLRGKSLKKYKLSIETLDGAQRVYISVNAVPYSDGQGRKLSVGIIENITDYMKLEEIKNTYRDKVQQLNTIINTISDGVCVIDANGDCVMGSTCDNNDLFPCVTGCPEKSEACSACNGTCNKSLKNYKIERENGEVVDIKKNIFNKLIKGKKIEKEIFVVKKDNKKNFVKLKGNPIFNNEGQVEYVVISMHDITRIKKQQIKINYQNEFINNIIDTLGTPVTVISYPQHIYEYANSQYVQMLSKILGRKVEREDIIGNSVYDIMQEEYLYLIIENIDMEKLVPKIKTIFFDTHNDGIKYYQTIHTPFKYSEKKIHVVIAGMDITSQIQLQKDIQALAKEKEDYFTTISHELRSPTAVINSVAQMLLSEYYKDQFNDKTKKLIKKVEKNSYRLLRLVNNFLDITKAESGFMSLNLNNIHIGKYTKSIVESVQSVASKKNIEIIFRNRCGDNYIALDVEKYERILFNLLSNAIKFTHHEGKIEVFLGEYGNYISLTVRDNGVGICKKDIDKIFDRFYMSDHSNKRPQEGTGIGLSLVKKLIELMEGSIEVKSTEGKGSEFILYFPKENLYDHLKDPALGIYNGLERNLAEKIFIEFSSLNI